MQMQKLKRIKKWSTQPQQCINNNNNNNIHLHIHTMTNATHRPVSITTTPNWITEPLSPLPSPSPSPSSTTFSAAAHCNKHVHCANSQRANHEICNANRNQHSGTQKSTTSTRSSVNALMLSKICSASRRTLQHHCSCYSSLLLLLLLSLLTSTTMLVHAVDIPSSTQPLNVNDTITTTSTTARTVDMNETNKNSNSNNYDEQNALHNRTASMTTNTNIGDSIIMQIAKRFSTGNQLWDDIIRDCYQRPSISCFQKNVYAYLSDTLDARDMNVTQRLKFYRNAVQYDDVASAEDKTSYVPESTESAVGKGDTTTDDNEATAEELSNEIPHTGRAAAETPIEEVTNALYGKSMKFAMTHDLEIKLPEVMFDGATFRISPRSFEGNGIIAKLELIPKQEVEARLAGKIIKKKIQKFLRNKVLLSFIALVLIIKIIKIKLFWLLPLIIGVGAAKKLLLKFLLFLFPALSHLFKLCSYYQQTYHSTKYHHHHHLINHHHTIVPQWHSAEHNSVPEIIYTHPPKGHISAYLHGAPIHETYGPPSHEHYEPGWENSGPGLGSDFISDINRVAQIEGDSNYFSPHSSDSNELHSWGLGSTQPTQQQQKKQPQPQQQQQQRIPPTQQQRPPFMHKPNAPLQQQQQQQYQQQQNNPQNYQKPHATSHSFNPFLNPDKQSIFASTKLKGPSGAHSMPSPVYVPQRHGVGGGPVNAMSPPPQPGALNAAQIAAQYGDPTRNKPQQQQQQQQPQLTPELAAQVKEALRIQAEQRLIAQQQKILEHQPFVQDGQPLMPKNYDPFYSPILQKIDKIVEQLGVTDELCKERLVCSMYKDPTRYSPHSNFVSAELSRDTSELEPVTNANQAVQRFYRLIQAARDGQDQRDCLRLYPQCSINTE